MRPSQSKHAPGKSGRRLAGPPTGVEAHISQLDKLGIGALRELWRRRFRGATPAIQSADVLRRLVAWKIQVEAFGDLDVETTARIRLLARSGKKDGAGKYSAPVNLKAGTVLVREWRGTEHRVLVLDAGFEHRDQRYKSLSHVARAITGTNWSGPRFFGLEPKQISSIHKNDAAS